MELTQLSLRRALQGVDCFPANPTLAVYPLAAYER